MKKFAVMAAALAISGSAAMAQQPRVPTGIDVKGPTYYSLEATYRGPHIVVHRSEACTLRDLSAGKCKAPDFSNRENAADNATTGGTADLSPK